MKDRLKLCDPKSLYVQIDGTILLHHKKPLRWFRLYLNVLGWSVLSECSQLLYQPCVPQTKLNELENDGSSILCSCFSITQIQETHILFYFKFQGFPFYLAIKQLTSKYIVYTQ